MVAIATLVATAITVPVVAGARGSSEKAEIVDVALAYVRAMAEGDAARVCESMTPSSRALLAEDAPEGTCEAWVRGRLSRKSRELYGRMELGQVEVDGSLALVDRADAPGSGIHLARHDSSWLVTLEAPVTAIVQQQ